MATTPWMKARQKQAARVEAGHAGYAKYEAGKLPAFPHFDKLSALYKQLEALTGASSYDTVAVAAIGGMADLVVALKVPGGEHVTEKAKGLARQAGATSVKVLTIGDDWEENLHSEMRIVRYLVEGRGTSKDNLKDAGIVIFCDKGVCPDCWGWLNKHGIYGYPPRKTKATGWGHPLTRANYYRSGNDLLYVKEAKYGQRVLTVSKQS
ncbi:hypothetical protein [Alloacidobacterium sp.]|uniref:hypothetical protein n=1 Tax=Alloacidobacterium sp. TaxID=2951999 RepID=UPI002D697DFE|nr:hypothetical protein [Alloacidobacterium sp.]HYK36263.1 hypothetical protein [Alloacidobacterium sp.]